MSLEQRITELTAAVIALTAAMAGGRNAVALPDAASENTAPAKSAESGEPSAPTVAPSYQQVKDAILAIAKQNRGRAMALLARFGAESGKDLMEAQWPEFHADAQRVLSGDYDPLEAQ